MHQKLILFLYASHSIHMSSTTSTQPVQDARHNDDPVLQEFLDANRYTTSVCIEVIESNIIRKVKWFSDLQMAYLWCINKIQLYDNEQWERVFSFQEFADNMDRRWRRGNTNGYPVAYSSRVECRAYYEPTVNRLNIVSRE
jgi:hypothetical protein